MSHFKSAPDTSDSEDEYTFPTVAGHGEMGILEADLPITASSTTASPTTASPATASKESPDKPKAAPALPGLVAPRIIVESVDEPALSAGIDSTEIKSAATSAKSSGSIKYLGRVFFDRSPKAIEASQNAKYKGRSRSVSGRTPLHTEMTPEGEQIVHDPHGVILPYSTMVLDTKERNALRSGYAKVDLEVSYSALDLRRVRSEPLPLTAFRTIPQGGATAGYDPDLNLHPDEILAFKNNYETETGNVDLLPPSERLQNARESSFGNHLKIIPVPAIPTPDAKLVNKLKYRLIKSEEVIKERDDTLLQAVARDKQRNEIENDLHERLATVQEEAENLQKKYAFESVTLNSKLAEAEQTVESQKIELEQLDKECQDGIDALELRTNEIAQLESKIEEKDSKIQGLEEKLRKESVCEEKCEKLQSERDDLLKRLEEMRQDAARRTDEKELLESRIVNLQEELSKHSDCDKTCAKLRLERNDLRKERNELRKALDVMQIDLDRCRTTIEDIRKYQIHNWMQRSCNADQFPWQSGKEVAQIIIQDINIRNQDRPGLTEAQVMQWFHANLDIEEILVEIHKLGYIFTDAGLLRNLIFNGNICNLRLFAAYLSLSKKPEDDTRVQLEEFKAAFGELRDQWETLTQLRDELERAKNERDTLQKALVENEDESLTSGQVAIIRSELREEREQKSRDAAYRDVLLQWRDSLLAKYTETHKSLEALQGEHNDIKSQLFANQKYSESLLQLKEKLQTDLAQARARSKAIESENPDIKSHLDAAVLEVAKLQKIVDSKASAEAGSQKELEQNTLKLQTALASVNDLTKKLRDGEAAQAAAEEAVQGVQGKMKKNKLALDTALRSNEDLTKQLKDSKAAKVTAVEAAKDMQVNDNTASARVKHLEDEKQRKNETAVKSRDKAKAESEKEKARRTAQEDKHHLKVSELTKEIYDLKTAEKAAQDRVSELETRLKEKPSALTAGSDESECETALAAANTKVDQLTAQLKEREAALHKQTADNRSAKGSLNAQIKQLQSNLDEQETKNEVQSVRNSELISIQSVMNTEATKSANKLRISRNVIGSLNAQLADAKAKLKEMEGTESTVKSTLKAAQDISETTNATKLETDTVLAATKEQIQLMKDVIVALSARVGELQEHVRKQDSEIKRLEAELEVEKGRAKDLEARLSEETDNLKAKLGAANAQVKDLEAQLSEKDSAQPAETDDLQAQLSATRKQVTNLEAQLLEHESALDIALDSTNPGNGLAAANDRVRDLEDRLAAQTTALTAEIEDHQGYQKTASEKNVRLNGIISGLSAQKAKTDGELDTQKIVNESLRYELENAQAGSEMTGDAALKAAKSRIKVLEKHREGEKKRAAEEASVADTLLKTALADNDDLKLHLKLRKDGQLPSTSEIDSAFKNTVGDSCENCHRLIQEVRNAQRNIREIEPELLRMTKDRDAKASNYDLMRDKFVAEERRNETLVSQLETAQAAAAGKSGSTTKTPAEIEGLQSELTAHITSHKNEIAVAQGQIASLTSQLQTAQATAGTIDTTAENTAEVERMQETINTLERNQVDAQNKHLALEEELRKLGADLQVTRNAHDTAVRHNECLVAEIEALRTAPVTPPRPAHGSTLPTTPTNGGLYVPQYDYAPRGLSPENAQYLREFQAMKAAKRAAEQEKRARKQELIEQGYKSPGK